MRNKVQNEELVSYASLGKFVRQKRKALGYNSAEKFAGATGIDSTYVKRIETGDGTFGSPERFVGLAKALGVTPGYLMDIFAEVIDSNGNIISTTETFTLPENFTDEDRKLVSDLISFLGYRKQLTVKRPQTTPQLSPEEAIAKENRRMIDLSKGLAKAMETPDVEPPVNSSPAPDQGPQEPTNNSR